MREGLRSGAVGQPISVRMERNWGRGGLVTEHGAERDTSQGQQHTFWPGRLGGQCISDHLEMREMTFIFTNYH